MAVSLQILTGNAAPDGSQSATIRTPIHDPYLLITTEQLHLIVSAKNNVPPKVKKGPPSYYS